MTTLPGKCGKLKRGRRCEHEGYFWATADLQLINIYMPIIGPTRSISAAMAIAQMWQRPPLADKRKLRCPVSPDCAFRRRRPLTPGGHASPLTDAVPTALMCCLANHFK
jgi:hypothetical protein